MGSKDSVLIGFKFQVSGHIASLPNLHIVTSAHHSFITFFLTTPATKKRFRELILSIQNLTMTEQGEALDKFIIDYRKEIEQTDDILVMGVSV